MICKYIVLHQTTQPLMVLRPYQFHAVEAIINTKKHHGIIYCFRNLRNATDDAIKMFSNKTPVEEILLQPYEYYVGQFEEAVAHLKAIVPEGNSLDELETENDEAEFIKAFRACLKLMFSII